MIRKLCIASVLVTALAFVHAQDIGEISTFITDRSKQAILDNSQQQQMQSQQPASEIKTATSTLISYSGSQLPSDWSLVSILDDRAVIGFKNGTSRNTQIDELDPASKDVIRRIQSGNMSSAALKDKLSQWGTQVSTRMSQFGKSLKEQFGNVFGPNNGTSTSSSSSITTIVN